VILILKTTGIVTIFYVNNNNENNNSKIYVIFPQCLLLIVFLSVLYIRALKDYLQSCSKTTNAHW